ncbi:hypothetical protein NA56DRAFT_710203 [Hyaloscypha hepaticicola]|uniref:Uncharacterized protein n=1 Tax=Hyaloscypha hepaticicola TaxID=2082293 RepID=A0A2J6PMM9_9HELO|nr:hypothetical protein NA56DRAFT_710203 [Hyaloscypha hepaticicola]
MQYDPTQYDAFKYDLKTSRSSVKTTPFTDHLKTGNYVSTAATPCKSTATQIDSYYNTPKQIATQIDSLESNTPEALESTVNAFTAVTTTAVPHTSTSPTTGHPGKSSVSYTSASLTFKNPAKSTYDANDLYEIDGLHEINNFEHGYWEGIGKL